ncbi:hypothetical protein PVAG01_03380 [Phlyctema vagabunda]|uniref:RING-type domain-containing protein n=1 Tax=Phlyctema vagabunda TaxID=108571 RepID=A0ABR4PL84_9HELO
MELSTSKILARARAIEGFPNDILLEDNLTFSEVQRAWLVFADSVSSRHLWDRKMFDMPYSEQENEFLAKVVALIQETSFRAWAYLQEIHEFTTRFGDPGLELARCGPRQVLAHYEEVNVATLPPEDEKCILCAIKFGDPCTEIVRRPDGNPFYDIFYDVPAKRPGDDGYDPLYDSRDDNRPERPVKHKLCSQVFGSRCLAVWLHGNKTCPHCRRDIRENVPAWLPQLMDASDQDQMMTRVQNRMRAL